MSWLEDLAAPDASEDSAQWRCRVYGHCLSHAAPALAEGAPEHRWLTPDELEELQAAESLESGERVIAWVRMWQAEEDEDGRPVTRGFGVPTTDVDHYSYNRNGNPQGVYRVGEFDDQGLPVSVTTAN